MSDRIGKWRPSLWLVLGGALAGTLALSFFGLIALRYLGPEIGFRNAAAVIAGIIAALTLVAWWLLLRLLLRPVSDLAEYAATVRGAPGALATPPTHFGTRDLSFMGASVIDMAATLQSREATIRSYTAHVTHELKTPVTAIRAACELLEDSPDLSPADRRLVAQIRGAGQQMQGHLTALTHVMRAREASHHGTCRLDDLPMLGAGHPDLQVTVTGGDIALPLAAEGMEIVLHQLFGNAAEMGARSVHVTVRPGQVTVVDDGPGISAGNRAYVFDPFYTTRRDAGGTGMGLAIVASLLGAHGGRITLDGDTDGTGDGAGAGGDGHGPGARFTIRFPGG